MNFLAHAHLSGNDEEILFGNFIADAVKGNGLLNFNKDVQNGIILHRRIDAFTDSHPEFRTSLGRIRQHFGKFTGIVVDIYYDHFLAANWKDYSNQKLKHFASHVYQILQQRYEDLPGRTRRILPYMVTQNWLVGYANKEDLRMVFYGMDRRTGYKSGMGNAMEVLDEYYTELKGDFMEFYPSLEVYAQEQINQITGGKINNKE